MAGCASLEAAEKASTGNGFEAQYQPLCSRCPGWGEIALLPWDEAIFRFPVADFRWGNGPPGLTAVDEFNVALTDFCRISGAVLVSARSAGRDPGSSAFLAAGGFAPVDFSVLAVRSRIKAKEMPVARFPLRVATAADHETIVRISGSAFEFGRYHGDARFPRALANQRYVDWIKRALNDKSPANHVFVLGRPGTVVGFMNVVTRERHADLRLGAVDPENELGFAGYFLYGETVRAAHALGATGVVAKIAAANTRVLNICAALKFQFSHPETTFHWYPPNIPFDRAAEARNVVHQD